MGVMGDLCYDNRACLYERGGERMPLRKTGLGTGHIYHVFSRGVNRAPIFQDYRECKRFIDSAKYCKFKEAKLSFSIFKKRSQAERKKLLPEPKERLVDVISYVLMPNHFHFVLRQETDGGIKTFLIRVLTGYSKYFNMKHKRSGPLFESRFKSVLIETDEQLLHVVRYVHLNPYSSLLVDSLNKLVEYPHSSLREYLDEEPNQRLCDDKEIVLSQFEGLEGFKRFTFNQADYQRELEQIKHLTLD
jgi:putative transposase